MRPATARRCACEKPLRHPLRRRSAENGRVDAFPWRLLAVVMFLVGVFSGDFAALFYVAGQATFAALGFVGALGCCIFGLACWEHGTGGPMT